MGATAVQAFGDGGWAYTAWLVAEAVTAVLVGIACKELERVGRQSHQG